jgi:hypothetical protein
MVRREELEATFLAYLHTLRLDPQFLAEFPSIAEEAWRKRRSDVERATKKDRARLTELKGQKSELLLAKLGGEVFQPDYAQMNAEFDLEALGLEEQIQAAEPDHISAGAFERFAKVMLLDVGAAWQHGRAEQKQRVQSFLFQKRFALLARIEKV